MERLIKVGKVKAKKASEIKTSRLGIGFEKLDRNVFDPEMAYDKLADIGVKWVRLQSGWERTEKEEGKYDFVWLDSIVDNLLERGLIPWICLCYGHGMYDEEAAKVFGGVGCPPIKTDRAKKAWAAYVSALTEHFKGRVTYYEVWNEPDGKWCWKHGPNGKEYGKFVVDTSIAVKAGDSTAKVFGGAICFAKPLDYAYDAFSQGMGDYIDGLSFHEYLIDETVLFRHVESLRGLCDMFAPNIEIIQGESGSQSRSDGSGAMRKGGWTPRKQAKQLARHLMVDLMTEVKFTSYFTCVDMIEALNGSVGDVASYLDYGYFGVLGADFDENGRSVGTYTPKPSYYTLQNIASLFSDDTEIAKLPIMRWSEQSDRLFGMDCDDKTIVSCGFRKKNGAAAFVYWNSTNLMTTEFESTITLYTAALPEKIRLIDLLDGTIYELPESILENHGDSKYAIKNIPITDYPLVLTFGDF